MLRFKVCIEFPPHAVAEAEKVLRSLVGPVRAEPGCSSTQLLRATGEHGSGLTYLEEWRDVEDFAEHLQVESFRKLVAIMELASEAPIVEIDGVAWRRGFEMVEEILGRTRSGEAGEPGSTTLC